MWGSCCMTVAVPGLSLCRIEVMALRRTVLTAPWRPPALNSPMLSSQHSLLQVWGLPRLHSRMCRPLLSASRPQCMHVGLLGVVLMAGRPSLVRARAMNSGEVRVSSVGGEQVGGALAPRGQEGGHALWVAGHPGQDALLQQGIVLDVEEAGDLSALVLEVEGGGAAWH